MKDFLGRNIEAGSTIVYPGRRGSSTFITAATVQSVNGASLTVLPIGSASAYGPREFSNRPVTIKNIASVTVIA